MPNTNESTARPLVSVVIPVFNEGPELDGRLRALAAYLSGDVLASYEIVVVDDGSADETYEVATRVCLVCPSMRVIRHDVNLGLGAAIRSGFAESRGALVVTYDSDQSYEPAVIAELVAHMQRTGADLVLASPYMRGGSVVNVPFLRRLLSREANRFLSFATNGRFATITCMVRAYRKAFFDTIESVEPRMEINPELFFKAIKRGAAIGEIPACLKWSAERAKARHRVDFRRTIAQIFRTMRYGIAHRPAVLLAIPGILPGVLPLIVAILALMHVSLRTFATVTLVTMVIQNASLALFAGQLAVFGRNVWRRPRINPPARGLE